MELAIQAAEPARWERHFRRRNEEREGDGSEQPPEAAAPLAPAVVEDGDDDAVYSQREPGEEDLFGAKGPSAR